MRFVRLRGREARLARLRSITRRSDASTVETDVDPRFPLGRQQADPLPLSLDLDLETLELPLTFDTPGQHVKRASAPGPANRKAEVRRPGVIAELEVAAEVPTGLDRFAQCGDHRGVRLRAVQRVLVDVRRANESERATDEQRARADQQTQTADAGHGREPAPVAVPPTAVFVFHTYLNTTVTRVFHPRSMARRICLRLSAFSFLPCARLHGRRAQPRFRVPRTPSVTRQTTGRTGPAPSRNLFLG